MGISQGHLIYPSLTACDTIAAWYNDFFHCVDNFFAFLLLNQISEDMTPVIVGLQGHRLAKGFAIGIELNLNLTWT